MDPRDIPDKMAQLECLENAVHPVTSDLKDPKDLLASLVFLDPLDQLDQEDLEDNQECPECLVFQDVASAKMKFVKSSTNF